MNSQKAKTNVIFNTLGLVLMLVMNYLAIALPLNNKTTAELSDKYVNCFVPAGITFSIWGIIYLLLIGFLIFQWYAIKLNNELFLRPILAIGPRFFISCIANAAWIVAWHYEYILVAFLIMLVLLFQLLMIYRTIQKYGFDGWLIKIFVKIPFSVYLGWIIVATLANLTILFMSMELNTQGPIWAKILIVIATFIGLLAIFKNKDIAFALVIIWALYGIYLKQTEGLDVSCEGVGSFAKYGLTFLIIYSGLSVLGKRTNQTQIKD